MDVCSEYLEIAATREGLYRFLSRVFRVEATEAFLDDLKTLQFPETGEEDSFAEGINELKAFIAKPGIDPRTDLAVDYARVFLGAGIADGSAAFPYESVYTSPEHLMMQDARDEVVALYLQKGLGVTDENHDPEDHIAFELDFMAHLIHEGIEAAEGNNTEALMESLQEQNTFLQTHLLNWVGEFCEDVATYASSGFYKATAKILQGYLAMDGGLLNELLAD